MKRLFKRLRDLRYRVENFWHWWRFGKLPARLAWKKSDLTL